MNEKLEYAIKLTLKHGASISMLQRKMMLGYNKASSLMEEMEKLGVVGQFDGTKPRKVLINSIDVIKSVCGDCLYYLTCKHESRDKQICDNYDNEP